MNSSYGGSSSRTSSTTASLRPRYGRLISGLDQGDEVSFDTNNSTTTVPNVRISSPLLSASTSPIGSREPSPMPARHLSRPTSARNLTVNDASSSPRKLAASDGSHVASNNNNMSPRRRQAGSSLRSHGAPSFPSTTSASRSRDQSPSLALFFSDSWSSIQGKATEMLGGTAPPPTRAPTDAQSKRRKPSHGGGRVGAQTRNTSAPPPPRQWGAAPPPATPNLIGIGSSEDREAEVRAMKRRDLLAASPEQHADSLGRFKRRNSDARKYTSAPPTDDENRDALVYVHHVKPNDTVAGITIKYNCRDATLRRANRMWPNDRLQVRQTIVLPVDACGAKGTPIKPGQDTHSPFEGSESQINNPFPTSIAEDTELVPPASTSIPTAPTGRSRHESVSTDNGRPLSSNRSSVEPEQQWIHDSWVLLPNSKEPTEIARLSRRNLGYFPPARRKSQSYSDLDTPSSSFDLARTPTLEVTSPLAHDPPQRPRRGRKLSNANNGYFPSYLSGPGGVGTMGKDVKSPGPGQDHLNKLFASHLPNVAPPPNQQNLYLPDIPLYTDDPTGEPAGAPSIFAAQSPGIGLDNVGGAIENWARKIATKARTALDTPEQPRSAARASLGVPGKGADGVGDLIEMADQFEIGGDDDEEEERGRQGSTNTLEHNNIRGLSQSVMFGRGQDTLRSRARSGNSAGATGARAG